MFVKKQSEVSGTKMECTWHYQQKWGVNQCQSWDKFWIASVHVIRVVLEVHQYNRKTRPCIYVFKYLNQSYFVSIYPCIYLSTNPSNHLSIYSATYLIHPSIYPSLYPLNLPIYPLTALSLSYHLIDPIATQPLPPSLSATFRFSSKAEMHNPPWRAKKRKWSSSLTQM